jgi:hypothetical protein
MEAEKQALELIASEEIRNLTGALRSTYVCAQNYARLIASDNERLAEYTIQLAAYNDQVKHNHEVLNKHLQSCLTDDHAQSAANILSSADIAALNRENSSLEQRIDNLSDTIDNLHLNIDKYTALKSTCEEAFKVNTMQLIVAVAKLGIGITEDQAAEMVASEHTTSLVNQYNALLTTVVNINEDIVSMTNSIAALQVNLTTIENETKPALIEELKKAIMTHINPRLD